MGPGCPCLNSTVPASFPHQIALSLSSYDVRKIFVVNIRLSCNKRYGNSVLVLYPFSSDIITNIIIISLFYYY